MRVKALSGRVFQVALSSATIVVVRNQMHGYDRYMLKWYSAFPQNSQEGCCSSS